MSLAPPKRPSPAPWSEMTEAQQEAYQLDLEVDELLDELQGVPPLEIAAGLIADPDEYGEAHSRRLAAALRARSTGHALAPMGKMPTATAPKPVKPPPIRSRPAKLEKPLESAVSKLL